QGLYVKGYTSRLHNSKKAVKSTVMLNFFDNNSSQEVLVTKDNGRFSFGPFFVEDSIAAIIQARRYNEKKEKDFLAANNNLKINLDTPTSFNLKKPDFEEDTNFAYASYQLFIANNKVAQALKDQTYNREVQLAEVVLTAKRTDKEDKMNQRVSDISFYGKPSNRVTVQDEDRVRNISVFDMLREVPGVTVMGSYPNHSVIIRAASSIYVDPTPLFMVDGVAVGLDFVSRMSTNDVWFIDVIKGARAAIFGVRGGNGVIAIYTGRPSDNNVTEREAGIVDISIKGFDKYREFYSPDYSKNISSVNRPDVRTTLYWNPYILLSKGKESSISFFTGDNYGDYIITMEGLSETGEPIFGTYEFSIQ
ncbi:TonB-dependent receptor plug domain-containing protein, partial [Saprospiraceae bacterium]|nr:TonB-dependent receptor plug domain-containing protein [Saprospiraceae bacterium]